MQRLTNHTTRTQTFSRRRENSPESITRKLEHTRAPPATCCSQSGRICRQSQIRLTNPFTSIYPYIRVQGGNKRGQSHGKWLCYFCAAPLILVRGVTFVQSPAAVNLSLRKDNRSGRSGSTEARFYFVVYLRSGTIVPLKMGGSCHCAALRLLICSRLT